MNRIFKTKAGSELQLIHLKGKEYLPVAQRLIWFREERPGWRIRTEFLSIADDHAICRAEIADENGNLLASAHKREDAKHFPDYLEKSETGAIGRCLALIGYGTQFASELDEEERVVDSPQEPKAAAPRQSAIRQREQLCCGQPMQKSKFKKNGAAQLWCSSCKRSNPA